MFETTSFTSAGVRLAGRIYRPSADGSGPCVVMGHGFSLTQDDGLSIFATRFAEAGLTTLTFDYRYLGHSEGEPRQRIRQPEQREDWCNAVAHAAGLDGVDADRMILWGYSMSGGHVTHLLSHGDLRPAAALMLAPFVDGLRRVLATPPRALIRVLPRAIADSAGRHRTIAATAQPGELGAMTLPGEADGFARSVPDGSAWRNEASPGVFTTIAMHRSYRRAGRIDCPLWVGLGERDISVHAPSVRALAARAPDAALERFDGDHFDLLTPPLAGHIADAQVAFLASRGLADQAT